MVVQNEHFYLLLGWKNKDTGLFFQFLLWRLLEIGFPYYSNGQDTSHKCRQSYVSRVNCFLTTGWLVLIDNDKRVTISVTASDCFLTTLKIKLKVYECLRSIHVPTGSVQLRKLALHIANLLVNGLAIA